MGGRELGQGQVGPLAPAGAPPGASPGASPPTSSSTRPCSGCAAALAASALRRSSAMSNQRASPISFLSMVSSSAVARALYVPKLLFTLKSVAWLTCQPPRYIGA